MPDYESLTLESSRGTPWNKGKLIGAKPPIAAKARMGDQNSADGRGEDPRSSHVQPRYR